jgi:hypothetical protein
VDGDFTVPSIIQLYNGADPKEVKSKDLAAFLKTHFPESNINVRDDFFSYWLRRCGAKEERLYSLAKNLAQSKVHHPDKKSFSGETLPGEVDSELKFLMSDRIKPVGVLYDGFQVMVICSDLLAPDEATWDHCHIILTNQLLGTWDENDYRYHVRVSLYGFPSAISTTGVIEGPARPREYYLGRTLGANPESLKKAFSPRYIGYGDPRLPEVIKGYLLQALFYHITGNPFCHDKGCRLFNAHWQEEMIYAQLRPGTSLCDFHRQILERVSCKKNQDFK